MGKINPNLQIYEAFQLKVIFATMFSPHLQTRICFTVTNDLNFDQRMQRICRSLAKNEFQVILTGRKRRHSISLKNENYLQKRIPCFFDKGKLFYIEYSFRLFFSLLFTEFDIICAIDLDTILPCYLISVLKRKKRVYDAHEYFTEQKEIISRKIIKQFWNGIAEFCIPRFINGYTVNEFIRQEFNKKYAIDYKVIRNLPVMTALLPVIPEATKRFIIYQGSINEGRSFETIIPAMKDVNCQLLIFGEGNYFKQTQQLILDNNLENKVILKGVLTPDLLKGITPYAYFGLMLFEGKGLNQIHSLSNRFFDYIMAGIPQICIRFPEYEKINDNYKVAWMINSTDSKTISDAMNKLLNNDVIYHELKKNACIAREHLNWESADEKKLISFYQNL